MKTRSDNHLSRVALAAASILVALGHATASAQPPSSTGNAPALPSSSYDTQIRRSQDPTNYYLDIAVTGLSPEQVRINLRGRVLIVEFSGQRQQHSVSPDGSAQAFIRQSQRMHLPVRLPADGDLGRMQRQNLPGMVRIIIPKLPSPLPRFSPVQPSDDDIRL